MKENTILYYFSGTGNAKRVAEWFKENAESSGHTTTLIDISAIERNQITPPEKNSIIGFCSPTHGFNFPPIMMYFIFRFPKSSGNKIFLINTRGGLKLGNIHIPGLSGTAQYLSAIILLMKGYKIVGMRSVDMPSNWLSLHPALRGKALKFIFDKCEIKTKTFTKKIINGRSDYRALFDLVQDLLITPISILYFFVGRFFLAKTFYASALCDNCESCIKGCPVKAIKIIDNRPFWTYKCESCMKCMNNCPKKAVNTAHGFAIGSMIFINSVIIFYIFRYLNEVLNLYHLPFPANTMLSFIESWTGLAFLFLFYRAHHFLLQINIIEKISKIFSLTSYNFWGRYKAPRTFNH